MSINLLLSIYNNLTYTIALTIFVSSALKNSKLKMAIYFVILFIVGFSMRNVQFFSMIPIAIVSTLYLYLFNRKWLISWMYSVTIFFALWLVTMLIAIPFYYFAPAFSATITYNIIMGLVSILTAFTLRFTLFKNGFNQWTKGSQKSALIIMITVLVVFGFFFPLLDTSPRGLTYFDITLLVAVILFTVTLVLNKLRITDIERVKFEQEAQFMETVKMQYEDMLKQAHYFGTVVSILSTLYNKNDDKGAKEYFTNQVKPIYEETSYSDRKDLIRIKHDVIRFLLENTFEKISMRENTTLRLEIKETIEFPKKLVTDIFKAMIVLINNAIESFDRQGKGALRISLENHKIVIENTIDQSEKESYENRHQREGKGLSVVKDIILSQRLLGSSTHIKENLFVQEIFIYER